MRSATKVFEAALLAPVPERLFKMGWIVFGGRSYIMRRGRLREAMEGREGGQDGI